MSKAAFQKVESGDGEPPSHYDKTDADGRKYYLKPLRAMGGQGDSREARPTLYYALSAPDGTDVFPKRQDGSDGVWRWKRQKVEAEASRIEWKQGRKGWSPYFRIFADTSARRPAETIWFHQDVGSNRASKIELKAVFPDDEPFATPKPTRLIERILQIATNPGDLILDSFAGSGTTGHAVLKLNAAENQTGLQDDGAARNPVNPANPENPVQKKKEPRRFILVEMEPKIAREVTAERVRRVAEGYVNAKGGSVGSIGGGFRYCTLGETLFDETGKIRESVRFGELARHVYFTETGEPLPRVRVPNSPLLGVCRGVAIYLLYNGILGDESANGGNVLTRATLARLPPFDGPKVVYCAGCLLGRDRLAAAQIVVRQTPYEIKVS